MKKRRIKFCLETGFENAICEHVIEFEENVTDKEIENGERRMRIWL